MTAPRLARLARLGEPGFESGGRVYENPLTRSVVPSITAVCGMLDKSALKFWAARQCAEYADANWPMLSTAPDRFDLIRNAPWRTSEKAADAGNIVHGWIDEHIKTGALPTGELLAVSTLTTRRMWGSFMRFVEVYQPQFTDAEFTVWSEQFGYAGTMDWSAKIGDWLVLGDTKTGKGTYPEVGLQVSAGAFADYIIEPDGTQRPIPKYDRYAVLHVRPTFVKLQPLQCIPECFEAFKAARTLKHWKDYVATSVIIDSPKIS